MTSTSTALRTTAFLAASFALLTVSAGARADDDAPAPALRPAASAPASADDCAPGQPVPIGYRCGRRAAFAGLLAGGGVTFALGDVFNLLTITSNGAADPVAFIPIVGPFVAAATHRTPPPPPSNSQALFSLNLDFSRLGYMVAGGFQTAGALLMVSSVFARGPVLKKLGDIRPVPLVTRTGSGLALQGTF
jgi:hypothetical protein